MYNVGGLNITQDLIIERVKQEESESEIESKDLIIH